VAAGILGAHNDAEQIWATPRNDPIDESAAEPLRELPDIIEGGDAESFAESEPHRCDLLGGDQGVVHGC
jgi:hypothetical protein